jgi:hypothetical protein
MHIISDKLWSRAYSRVQDPLWKQTLYDMHIRYLMKNKVFNSTQGSVDAAMIHRLYGPINRSLQRG